MGQAGQGDHKGHLAKAREQLAWSQQRRALDIGRPLKTLT